MDKLADDTEPFAHSALNVDDAFTNLEMQKNTATSESSTTLAPGEVVLGYLHHLDALGNAWINLPQFFAQPCPAMTTIPLDNQAKGKQLVIAFINGQLSQPIITGVVRTALDYVVENTAINSSADTSASPQPLQVSRDGQIALIEADQEIQLKCGESSITLNKDGKIVLRGRYIVSRASGTNRILGGSVQVN